MTEVQDAVFRISEEACKSSDYDKQAYKEQQASSVGFVHNI